MKFTELHVEGYRSLVDVTLPMRDLAVMIGPNGSGKTSVLDVVQLLRDASEGNLGKALEGRGGLNAVLSRLTDGPHHLKIELRADAEIDSLQEPLHYNLELLPRDVGYEIASERLRGQKLRAALARTRLFSSLDVGPRSVVALPQVLTPATSPGPNGEQLYSALYNLRALHRDSAYARVEEVLRIAFPDFNGLEFPVVGAGQVTMAWRQEGLSRPLYPNDLSEGTLRFLWLSTVLLAPEPSPITLIDEPEVSLHPELLKLLAGLMQDAACRGQIIVATHSADLVRWLKPAEVLVLDKVDGRTEIKWADSLDLDEWLKEYTLGELWQMGTLGGRP